MKKFDKDDVEKIYAKAKKLHDEGKYEDALAILHDMQIDNLPMEKRWAFYEAKGMCQIGIDKIREGVENLRNALFSPEGMPLLSQRRIASNYFINLHYIDGISDKDMFDAHTLYNQMFLKNIAFPHKKQEKRKIY